MKLKLYFRGVKIVLEISPEHYDRPLRGVSQGSSLYAVLKNGVVLHHTETGPTFRTIEMLARSLFADASRACAEALP